MPTQRTSVSPWIAHRSGMSEARVRLFCFPHAGGSAAAYRTWPRHLPARVELCPIELPGRKRRSTEAPYRSCERLALDIASAIRHELDRPYVFFGHSLGSLVAFEVTRELRRAGQPLPRHLYVSARRAPHLPLEGEAFHRLPDADLVSRVAELDDTIPPCITVEPGLLKPLLTALRADLEVHESYSHRAEAPLPCAISALGGMADPLATMEQLWSWRRHTAGSFLLKIFGGGHFYLRAHEGAVVQLVVDDLEETAAAA